MYCFRRRGTLLVPAAFVLASLLASCNSVVYDRQPAPTDIKAAQAVTTAAAPGQIEDRVTLIEVERIAQSVDKSYEDGWICGREPRIFKSPYGKLSALLKAKFAMAYHDFLEKVHQDLANDRATYLPYSKRTAFARQYWENSEVAESFKNEKEKYQIAWIHESLLDGSELWWRAAEKRFGARINSASTLSHDTEQNMVFKYMEDQNTESTFSAQLKPKQQ